MTTRSASITATPTTLTTVVGVGLADFESVHEVRYIGEVHVRRDGQDDEVTPCRHYRNGAGSFPHTTAAEAIECGRQVAAALGVEIRDE